MSAEINYLHTLTFGNYGHPNNLRLSSASLVLWLVLRSSTLEVHYSVQYFVSLISKLIHVLTPVFSRGTCDASSIEFSLS